MTTLAVLDIFKNQFELTPAKTQSYMSIIGLAWTPKLLYGIFTDTFPICGSRKKSYLVVCGLMQAMASLAVVLSPAITPPYIVGFCLISSLCSAVMDVVVDGLMVIMAKKDPDGGSEDLQSFSWVMYGVGGVSGALLGGAITKDFDPFYAFYVVAFFGILICCAGLTLDSRLEGDNTDMLQLGFVTRSSVVLKQVWKGIQLRELNRAVFFFVLMGCIVPNFESYIYYYQLNVVGFTKFQYALLMMFGFVTLITGSLLFNSCFRETNFRLVIFSGCVINFIGSILTLMFVRQLYLGLSPMMFVVCTSTVTDTFAQSFITLPSQVLFAKLIPENIESSMFALLTGLLNLSNLFLAP